MKVLRTDLIEEFGKKHADARSASSAWLQEVCEAEWEKPADIKQGFPTASFLPNRVVVFNIKGNDYRLVAAIDYEGQILFIKWLGTHAEYDKIDVRTIQYDD